MTIHRSLDGKIDAGAGVGAQLLAEARGGEKD
jgi:hypothetical protein